MGAFAKANKKFQLPPALDWRTTDSDEIDKRRGRALEEAFGISNATPAYPIFSSICSHACTAVWLMAIRRKVLGMKQTCIVRYAWYAW